MTNGKFEPPPLTPAIGAERGGRIPSRRGRGNRLIRHIDKVIADIIRPRTRTRPRPRNRKVRAGVYCLTLFRGKERIKGERGFVSVCSKSAQRPALFSRSRTRTIKIDGKSP